jgi:U3 small nucleolar RNA-associated protein 13
MTASDDDNEDSSQENIDEVAPMEMSADTDAAVVAAPTLSKSWSIASAHVPIFTGGKVVACNLQGMQDQNEESGKEEVAGLSSALPCLLLPVGGDLAVVDAQRGIKLGSVRSHEIADQRKYEDEDEGIDADAITSYALSCNDQILITCTHNHLIRQYAFQTTITNMKSGDGIRPDVSVSVLLQKNWGRSGHLLPVTHMELQMSSVFLASGSVDGTVRIWDARGGYVTHIFRPLAGGAGGGSGRLSVTCIKWLDDRANLVVAIGRDDGSIAIHNLRDKDMKHAILLTDHLSAVTSMNWWSSGVELEANKQKFSYPTHFVSAGRDAVVNLWRIDEEGHKKLSNKTKKKKAKEPMPQEFHAPTYRRKHTLPIYEQIEGMVVLPSGAGDGESDLVLVTAGSKGRVRAWQASMSEEGDISELSKKAEQPASQAFGEARGGYLGILSMTVPDNSTKSQLILVDAEHCLSFAALGLDSWLPLAIDRTIVGFNDDVLDLKVLPSSPADRAASNIVVATNSPQVRLFGLDNFSCAVLDGHSATVLCVDVSPCGRYIATCGKDKKMCVWHVRSHTCVATAVGHTEAVGGAALSRKPGTHLSFQFQAHFCRYFVSQPSWRCFLLCLSRPV